MKVKRNLIGLFILLCCFFTENATGQPVYFADGYHGGIYGHYPNWKTQFMVDQWKLHPDWKMNLEIEPETWDSVRVWTPEAYLNFKEIVRDKRIEFVNPAYAQPYCYNTSGESLIRQFDYGMKKIRSHFPDVEFVTYSVEEPCFTSCLPQILKSFGYKYAVTKNPNTCWGGYTAAYGGELVNWIGPDGTSILTVPRYACEELEENSTWQTTAWSNSEKYLEACFAAGIKHPIGMCFQDAGWKNGPWLGFGDSVKNASIYQTWREYFENVSDGKTSDDWYFSQEDVLPNLMWGSQVLQKLAQEVRCSENKIVMAEKINAMACILTGKSAEQADFDEAWRTLMLSQHHDCWIVPYNRLRKSETWAQFVTQWTATTNTLSDKIVLNATAALFPKSSNAKDEISIVVFNTLGFQRNELIKAEITSDLNEKEVVLVDSKGKKIPFIATKENNIIKLSFKAEVPAFGFNTFKLQKGKINVAKSVKGVTFLSNGTCRLENDLYRIIIDPSKGGRIKSLIAKKLNNKEFVDEKNTYSFNELQGHFFEENRFYSTTEQTAKITVLEDNPLNIKIQIETQIASHPCVQTIELQSGQARIDFSLDIDWKGNPGIGEYKQQDNTQENRRAFTNDRYKLSLLFPAALDNQQLYKNAPFDVCKSQLKNTFFGAWDSIKHNIILNWVDVIQQDEKYGLALFTDHTTSYLHGEDYPLGLTVQYSGKGLWGRNYDITRPTRIQYALLPHAGKWEDARISTASACWNETLIPCLSNEPVSHRSKSMIRTEQTGYEISAVYKGDDGALYCRIFNAEAKAEKGKIVFDFPFKKLEEVKLNGEVVSVLKAERKNNQSAVDLAIPQMGLKTIKITL